LFWSRTTELMSIYNTGLVVYFCSQVNCVHKHLLGLWRFVFSFVSWQFTRTYSYRAWGEVFSVLLSTDRIYRHRAWGDAFFPILLSTDRVYRHRATLRASLSSKLCQIW